jgi:hypothetical protein
MVAHCWLSRLLTAGGASDSDPDPDPDWLTLLISVTALIQN